MIPTTPIAGGFPIITFTGFKKHHTNKTTSTILFEDGESFQLNVSSYLLPFLGNKDPFVNVGHRSLKESKYSIKH